MHLGLTYPLSLNQSAFFPCFPCTGINQVDDQLKAEGILSIGGFLRSSKSLLVLWDPTYVLLADSLAIDSVAVRCN